MTDYRRNFIAGGSFSSAAASNSEAAAGERPGDPEAELPYTLEEVFGRFGNCPEERAVIDQLR
jgi:hypothetical protein